MAIGAIPTFMYEARSGLRLTPGRRIRRAAAIWPSAPAASARCASWLAHRVAQELEILPICLHDEAPRLGGEVRHLTAAASPGATSGLHTEPRPESRVSMASNLVHSGAASQDNGVVSYRRLQLQPCLACLPHAIHTLVLQLWLSFPLSHAPQEAWRGSRYESACAVVAALLHAVPGRFAA